MSRPTFDQTMCVQVAKLTHEMRNAGMIAQDQFLISRVGSPTKGLRHYVAITGGELGSGELTIETLEFPSDTRRADFLQSVKLAARMLYIANYVRDNGSYPHHI